MAPMVVTTFAQSLSLLALAALRRHLQPSQGAQPTDSQPLHPQMPLDVVIPHPTVN